MKYIQTDKNMIKHQTQLNAYIIEFSQSTVSCLVRSVGAVYDLGEGNDVRLIRSSRSVHMRSWTLANS